MVSLESNFESMTKISALSFVGFAFLLALNGIVPSVGMFTILPSQLLPYVSGQCIHSRDVYCHCFLVPDNQGRLEFSCEHHHVFSVYVLSISWYIANISVSSDSMYASSIPRSSLAGSGLECSVGVQVCKE